MKLKPELQNIRNALKQVPAEQLAVAVEALAFLYVDVYLELHPIRHGATAAQRDAIRTVLILRTIQEGVNVAAEVLTGTKAPSLYASPEEEARAMTAAVQGMADAQPSPEDETLAKAQADAAIAKAQGRLQ